MGLASHSVCDAQLTQDHLLRRSFSRGLPGTFDSGCVADHSSCLWPHILSLSGLPDHPSGGCHSRDLLLSFLSAQKISHPTFGR